MTDPELLKEAGYMCIQIGPHLWHVRGAECRGYWDKVELFPEHKLVARYSDGTPTPYTDPIQAVRYSLTPFLVETAEQKQVRQEWQEGLKSLYVRYPQLLLAS